MNFKEFSNIEVKAKEDAKKRGLTHSSHNIWKDKQGKEYKWNSNTKRFEKITIGRAWEGNLKKINTFLSFVYNKMKSSDQNLKDSVFNKYYRFYNDGDIKALPKAKLEKLGLEKKYIEMLNNRPDKWESKDSIKYKNYQEALEKSVETIIKYLLKKYKKSTSQREVNVANLKEIRKILDDYKYKSAYWVERFGEESGNEELINYAKKLKKLNKGISLVKDLKNLSNSEMNRIKELIDSIIRKREIIKECEEIIKK